MTELIENGIIVLPHLIDINGFEAEFDKCVSASAIKYAPGKAARVPREQFNLIPTIIKEFSSAVWKQFAIKYLKNCDYLLQIFMSYENRVLEKEEWSRNLHLHFDPYRALKFMIYLTDTTVENGAFGYVKGSREIGKKLRSRNSLEKNLNSNTYRVDAHNDFMYLQDDVIYVEGKAGTAIIFDTDLIHGGGVIKSGHRKVVIAHSR